MDLNVIESKDVASKLHITQGSLLFVSFWENFGGKFTTSLAEASIGKSSLIKLKVLAPYNKYVPLWDPGFLKFQQE